MKVGLIQHKVSHDVQANFSRTLDAIKQLSEAGAQVICTQELFKSRYFCFEENRAHFELAESLHGQTMDELVACAKTYGVVLIASLFEERTSGLYHNTSVVIDADGTPLGRYRKMHIPEDPGFHEKFYFTPGDEGYKVFQTKFGKVGVLICWDQWYPEAARLTALKGAEILFYPTAIGWDVEASKATNMEELEAWKTIQRSHAIANGIPVVSVNRVGIEEGTAFWGNSFVCNAFGTILQEGPSDSEATMVVDVELDKSTKYRQVWPFLRDRRIDSYQALLKRMDDE